MIGTSINDHSILKISVAKTADEFTDARDKIDNLIICIGGLHIGFEKKELLVEAVVNHAVKETLRPGYNQ